MSSESPVAGSGGQQNKPDLDSKENIRRFIDLFYEQVLTDQRLAPIFIDVAKIDLAQHKSHIYAYWEKLLLGEDHYHRHTMEIHRVLNAKHPFQPEEFERWLGLFLQTADAHFAGPNTERAKKIATNIAGNMEDRFYYHMAQPRKRHL